MSIRTCKAIPSQAEQTKFLQPLLEQPLLPAPSHLGHLHATHTRVSVSVPHRRFLVWAEHLMGLRYGSRICLWIFWFHSACIAVDMGGSPAVCLLPRCCLCPPVSAEVLLLTSHCPGCRGAWDCTLHFGSSNKKCTFQLE